MSRAHWTFFGGLAFTALLGCQHQSSVPTLPPAPEKVKVGSAFQVEQLLEGRIPGVEVLRTRSGGFLIHVRGVTTLHGDGEPLYVVDGLPVEIDPERGLDWLSPAEIERIEVLKDAVETSMYGVRGANGVLLITTKRPHKP